MVPTFYVSIQEAEPGKPVSLRPARVPSKIPSQYKQPGESDSKKLVTRMTPWLSLILNLLFLCRELFELLKIQEQRAHI